MLELDGGTARAACEQMGVAELEPGAHAAVAGRVVCLLAGDRRDGRDAADAHAG